MIRTMLRLYRDVLSYPHIRYYGLMRWGFSDGIESITAWSDESEFLDQYYIGDQ